MDRQTQDTMRVLRGETSPLGARLAEVERRLYLLDGGADLSEVPICVLPGGRKPERKSKDAIGFDVYSRAVVSKDELTTVPPIIRKTLFDFFNPSEDSKLAKWAVPDPDNQDKLALLIPPGESVLIGTGFISAADYPIYLWMTPRSGHAMRGITLSNAPGTIDPDYRGEAGALLKNNSSEPFLLQHEMRIAQVIVTVAAVPLLVEVNFIELPETSRGSGGFGSTGSFG